MDASLALTEMEPYGVAARQAAERARELMDIESGTGSSSFSATERLMLYVGHVRWLAAMIYDSPVQRDWPRGYVLPAEGDLSKLVWDMAEAARRLSNTRRARVDELSGLDFLARRLETVDCADTRRAATHIRALLADRTAERADSTFYERVWVDVTHANDRREFAPEHAHLMAALEVELAGCVYGRRLIEGTLVRRESVPVARPKPQGVLRRIFG